MKFTVEVTEEEIAAAIRDEIKRAVVTRVASWRTAEEIRREVEAQWAGTTTAIVRDAMVDVPALRAKVLEKIERMLTAQVNAAIRIKDEK